MKIHLRYLLPLLFSVAGQVPAQTERASLLCNATVLKSTANNIGKLSLTDVKIFLSTFDESCKNNAEYSEWSNELLFATLKTQPDLLLEAIANLHKSRMELILANLGAPIHDGIDLSALQIVVQNAQGLTSVKNLILLALKRAKQRD